jgi:hypothetical protein
VLRSYRYAGGVFRAPLASKRLVWIGVRWVGEGNLRVNFDFVRGKRSWVEMARLAERLREVPGVALIGRTKDFSRDQSAWGSEAPASPGRTDHCWSAFRSCESGASPEGRKTLACCR